MITNYYKKIVYTKSQAIEILLNIIQNSYSIKNTSNTRKFINYLVTKYDIDIKNLNISEKLLPIFSTDSNIAILPINYQIAISPTLLGYLVDKFQINVDQLDRNGQSSMFKLKVMSKTSLLTNSTQNVLIKEIIQTLKVYGAIEINESLDVKTVKEMSKEIKHKYKLDLKRKAEKAEWEADRERLSRIPCNFS